ncbi:MAG TPA: hypothetical protein VFN71_08580 [Methylomirabilota bacterium]|nr:hypothetical protein [Methylomirabilota bacterium]
MPLTPRSFGQEHHGLDRPAVAFWDVHELADAEHSDVGDHIVVTHATTDELQVRIRRAARTSLGISWLCFDGMNRQHGRV